MGRGRRVMAAAAAGALALTAASALPAAPSETTPGSVSVGPVPSVANGDTISLTGVVSSGGVPISGIDVAVKLYTLPNCASGPSPRGVVATAADGTFTFTDTIAVN